MKHVDLFSGIGGFSLACDWLGIETIGFVEIDPFCQKILKKHWPGVPIVEDIRNVKNDTFQRPVDIITGGFPCQPFSTAGKQRGTDDDRYLWPEMLRIIRQYQPTWVVAENVIGITRHLVFQKVLSDLESVGYEATPISIPACAIGADHIRQRVIFCAYSDSKRLSRGKCKQLLDKTPQRQIKILHRERNRQENSLPEPRLCGSLNGIPDGMDRIKALGNAIVPGVAYEVINSLVNQKLNS